MLTPTLQPLLSARAAKLLDNDVQSRLQLNEFELMEQAAARLADTLITTWPNASFLFLCGAGNNGGDGLVAAALLARLGFNVSYIRVYPSRSFSPAAQQAYEMSQSAKVHQVNDDEIDQYDVVVDAVFGIGFSGELDERVSRLFAMIAEQKKLVAAVDLPSGLCATTGAVAASCLRASLTVTFFAKKIGMVTGRAKEHCGEIVVHDLGAKDLLDNYSEVPLLTEIEGLPAPSSATFKHQKGHVVVISGAKEMLGASVLSARASLHSGAGLTSLVCDASQAVHINTRYNELMTPSFADIDKKIDQANVVVFGPGAADSPENRQLLERLSTISSVIDATGLRMLAKLRLKLPEAILTPHSGEAAELLGIGVEEVEANRIEAAKEIAKTYGAVTVLKGAGTVVTDGNDVRIIGVGNPALAVAGAGDVLAGTIAAMKALGLPPLEAAMAGAYWHGAAADYWAGRNGYYGLRISELLELMRLKINGKLVK